MSKGHQERRNARAKKKQETRQERVLLLARQQAAKRLHKAKGARR